MIVDRKSNPLDVSFEAMAQYKDFARECIVSYLPNTCWLIIIIEVIRDG
jgi:hypothetical protein